MSVCSVRSPYNNQPSILHSNLFRYYNMVGVGGRDASTRALADWATTLTPAFIDRDTSVVTDINHEPVLFTSGEAVLLEDLTDQELKIKLDEGHLPVYITEEGDELTAVTRIQPIAPNTMEELQLSASTGVNFSEEGLRTPAMVSAFAKHLSKQFKVPVEEVTETAAIEMFVLAGREYKGEAGFNLKGKAYIVPGKASAGVVVHEVFGHPFLTMLERDNPSLFVKLGNEAIADPIVTKYIRKEYPELIREDGSLTKGGITEAILYVMELEAGNQLKELKNSGALMRLLKSFWGWLSGVFSKKNPVVLDSNTTIQSLVSQVLEGRTIDLSGSLTEGLHRTATGTNPQQESVDAVVTPNKNTKLIIDPKTNLGEYKNLIDPTAIIKRGTEMLEDYMLHGTLYTPEEKADYMARHAFIKQGHKTPDMADTKTTITFGSGLKSKEYTLQQLYYEFLKQASWDRVYASFAHGIMAYDRNPTPENKARLDELSTPKVHPDDHSIVVFEGIKNPNREIASWTESTAEDISPAQEISNMYGLGKDSGAVSLTEQVIAIPDMGFATSMDLLNVYEDGTYGAIDYKFGSVSNHSIGKLFRDLDKGYTFQQKAILEHVFRCFALRIQNPSARFRYMDVIRLKKTHNRVSKIPDYKLETYLLQIQRMIEAKFPHLVKKYTNMGLFDTNQYYASSQGAENIKKELIEKEEKLRGEGKINNDVPIVNQSVTMLLESCINLNSRIGHMKEQKGAEGEVISLKRQLSEETQKLAGFMNTNVPAQELYAFSGAIPTWILDNMNRYDVNDPGVRAVINLYDKQLKIVQERMYELEKVHDVLHKDIMNDYKSRHASPFGVALGRINYHKEDRTGLYDFMYVISDYMKGKSVRFISENTDKKEWALLTPAQQRYARFVLSTMEKAYNTAVANKVIAVGATETRTKADALGLPAKWNPDDAMVYLGLKADEVNERPGIDEDFVSKMRRWFTSTEFDYEVNRKAGIPVKYMNQPEGMRTKMMHSMDIEHMFKRFTEHMYSTELMEGVFAFSQGVQAEMELRKMTDSGVTNMDRWLGWFTTQFVEGTSPNELQTIISTIRSRKDPSMGHNVTADKIITGMKDFTTFATLGINPVLSAANFAYTMLVEARTVAIEGVIGKMLGVKTPQHFGLKDWIVGIKEALKMAADIAKGTQEDNVLYQFIKKYKFNPNDVMYASDPKAMAYAKRKFLSRENLTMLHSLGENRALVTILGAMMHKSKIKKGNTEMSLLDAYKVVEKVHPTTQVKYKDIEWVGGTRGVIKKAGTGTGGVKAEFDEVKELTSEELNAIKKGSAELTGDYRQSERSPADSILLWSIFTQFKRFMRRYIANALKPYGEDSSLGHYIRTGEHITENGEKLDEMEWQRIHTEGYLRILAHQMMSWVVFSPNLPFKALAKKLGYSDEYIDKIRDRYQWDKLNDYQKTQLIKGFVQMGFTVVSIFALYGWDDDESPIKRRIKKIFDDATDGMNPIDMLGMARYGFPFASKTFNLFDSSFTILASLATGERTEEGGVEGWADFQNVFGPLQSARTVSKIMEDMQ